MSGALTSWFDAGQNRESGGHSAERTDYASGGESSKSSGSGPAR